jgi:hypothetical protein
MTEQKKPEPAKSPVPKQMQGKVVAKSGQKEVVIKHGRDG